MAPIVEEVRTKGDDAVKAFTAKFDRVNLSSVCVPIEVCTWARGRHTDKILATVHMVAQTRIPTADSIQPMHRNIWSS